MPAIRLARGNETSHAEIKMLGHSELAQATWAFVRPVEAASKFQAIYPEASVTGSIRSFLEIADRTPSGKSVVLQASSAVSKQGLAGAPEMKKAGLEFGGLSLAISLILGMTLGSGKNGKPPSSEKTKAGEERREESLVRWEREPSLFEVFTKPLVEEFDRHDRGNLLTVAGVLTFCYFTSPGWMILAGKAVFSLLQRRNRIPRLFEGWKNEERPQLGNLGMNPLSAAEYAQAAKLRIESIDEKLPRGGRLKALEQWETLLNRMDPGHPEYHRALKYLLKLAGKPRSFDPRWESGLRTSDIMRRITGGGEVIQRKALDIYRNEIANRPSLEASEKLTAVLRERIQRPISYLEMFVFNSLPMKLLESANAVRKEYLTAYLEQLPQFPQNHPELIEALRLIRSEPIVELARRDPMFGRQLLRVLDLPVMDFEEVRLSLEALDFLRTGGGVGSRPFK